MTNYKIGPRTLGLPFDPQTDWDFRATLDLIVCFLKATPMQQVPDAAKDALEIVSLWPPAFSEGAETAIRQVEQNAFYASQALTDALELLNSTEIPRTTYLVATTVFAGYPAAWRAEAGNALKAALQEMETKREEVTE